MILRKIAYFHSSSKLIVVMKKEMFSFELGTEYLNPIQILHSSKCLYDFSIRLQCIVIHLRLLSVSSAILINK
jgi:hypothetical protein